MITIKIVVEGKNVSFQTENIIAAVDAACRLFDATGDALASLVDNYGVFLLSSSTKSTWHMDIGTEKLAQITLEKSAL